MSFTRKVEDFTCEHCGREVHGNGYTNHCPHCLHSKHVDVNPGDRAGLEAALTALLADPRKRATMGEAGREIASSRDSSKMVDAYETLFEAALGGTAPAVAVAT